MINIKDLVLKPEWYIKKFSDKNYELKSEVDKVVSLYNKYQELLSFEQEQRTKLNKITSEIKDNNSTNLKEEAAAISKSAKESTKKLVDLKESLEEIMSFFPNPADSDVPIGLDEDSNIVISSHHDELKENSNAIPHWEFLEKKDYILNDESGRISGARHIIYKGKLAMLVSAIEKFMIDEHINNGNVLIEPPVIVNEDSLYNTGQLPKFKEDLYQLDNGQYLIPTAEVPLTNIVANKILSEQELPIRYVALTNCFRKEAGSAGKDTRGLIRLHQFRKVELVTIGDPDNEKGDFSLLIQQATSILDKLEIPYRIIKLCSGDTSFSAKVTHDIEAWMPGVAKYREVSSVSSIGDFQSRRMKARIAKGEKKVLAFTYNGSALAIERMLAAIIENNIDDNGDVEIPKVLKPYLSFDKI